MRIFSGRFRLLKSEANFLTEAIDVRSNSMTSTCAVGISFTIASLTLAPVDKFRTAITT